MVVVIIIKLHTMYVYIYCSNVFMCTFTNGDDELLAEKGA